jgi:hypothetical protein
MFVATIVLTVLLLCSHVIPTPISSSHANFQETNKLLPRASSDKISPKVFIISMFDSEEEVWFGIPEFNILAQNITLPHIALQMALSARSQQPWPRSTLL